MNAGRFMATRDKMLNEISVTGHRHIVRMKGNTLVAQVANTELASLGTANDVLSRLPFINMDGDEISIVGKGKPQVFIDNRPVRDESELQMLRSENQSLQNIKSSNALETWLQNTFRNYLSNRTKDARGRLGFPGPNQGEG